jgi:EPS-associated MarR family transcriptional regulator
MIKNASRYDETHLKLMRLVQATPAIVQRDVAKALGMSLGRTNFCIKTLVNQGLLTIENVRSSDNKRSYAYWLTPEGKAEKAALTGRLLRQKKEEYELLKVEFDLLQKG